MKVTCSSCLSEFKISIRSYNLSLKRESKNFFCSNKCVGLFKQSKSIFLCTNCNKPKLIISSAIKKNKSGNFFCNHSCATTYQNTHKKFGTRKSKLEVWLESKLLILYPNLEILYASKEAINSELDIYIPSLNLAFELNGIYHYEPIHGQNKLDQVQNNDQRKFQACLEKGIELCIIDTSQHKYVKESTNLKYLEIIQNIVNFKLLLVTE